MSAFLIHRSIGLISVIAYLSLSGYVFQDFPIGNPIFLHSIAIMVKFSQFCLNGHSEIYHSYS